MAGLEPARALYGPTDFKSVASTISPHRRALHVKLVMQAVKTNFAVADALGLLTRAARHTTERVLPHEAYYYGSVRDRSKAAHPYC